MKSLLLIIIFSIRLLSTQNINYLKYESSPYLLQHANNPIHWMPYSQKAFDRAKIEHKNIFISIGYSTCHWCHVMLKESFEDKEIIYMEGYISDFKKLLKSMEFKKKDKFLKNNISNKNSELSLDSLATSIKTDYDDIYGGFGTSKKFPQVSKLWLMLDIAQKLDDDELLGYFFETLDMMALRGLYDQVDGGFFRYSVDEFFRIPHFEKMLYTQAELIPLYTKAYLLKSKKLYKNIVIETIDMLEKRFAYGEFFYSASDADSNHKEGGYFTFRYDEILASLKDNQNKKNILKALRINKSGNFNGKIHLNIYDSKRANGFDKFVKKLKIIRKSKQYPFIDKKIITSWNAMMIEAYFSASQIDEKYIIKANKHLKALTNLMFDRGLLYHQTMPNNIPKQKGLLEDYAFYISSFIWV